MKNPRKQTHSQRGFALIITVSMMVLLALLAVGLLSLSTISLRGSNRSAAQAEAKANARMALMMAIGDLQKYAGPDTRVTARADILNEDNPPVLGVWRSWEGENHEQSGRAIGRPIAPDYEDEKEDRRLSWLVSGEGDGVPDTSAADSKVTLLGEGSLGTGGGQSELEIHLDPVEIREDGDVEGSMAWWVSGENQKARIPNPTEPTSDTNGQWAARMKSHGVANPEIFRMEGLLDDPSPAAKAITLQEANFIADGGGTPVSQEFYHDLSATSVGLLTNVATGGWKKDLSLFTESSDVGARGLPLFRVAPGEDSMATMATSSSPAAPKSILYPWASYRGSSSSIPIYQHGPVASWANLVDYAKLYDRIRTSSSGKGSLQAQSEQIRGNAYNFLHRVRLLPVIARIQWVFSHTAGPSTDPEAEEGDLEARLLMTPVLTMWNPYNVELNFNTTPVRFRIPKPLPVAFRYQINGVQARTFSSLISGNLTNSPPLATTNVLEYQITQGFSLVPGETIMLSPASTRPVNAEASNARLTLRPGYRSQGGHYFVVKDSRRQDVTGPPSTLIQADARFDTEYSDRERGVGIYLNMNFRGGDHLVYRMVYTPEVARQVYPELTGMSSATLAEVQRNPKPFMTTIFGARMASRTHLSAKGFVQSSPLVNYTAMGGKDRAESTIGRHYGGTDHPVNSPFDYSFEVVTPFDSLLPNEDDSSNRGYIVTGFVKADGLSRCVIAELPTRPMQSLGELQHWDLRYENPIPPFAFNLIGNSDASPLLPSDAVVNRADAGLAVNLQHDDSYCANHLLFDDWFFSSIAPDPDSFGGGRSQEDVYIDMLTGEVPPPNRAYRAIQEDTGLAAASSQGANELYRDYVDDSEAWKTIASRLEVEGMFNVNSTSVTAWRALLGHARNQEVPYIQESGAGWDVRRSSPTDHPISRFSISGDVEATESGSSGAFPDAAEFAGYREFDDELIDLLAEEIVEQVRLRGPFLSLAEFVNRQLSSGDLALAGAIQTALNELAESGANNPYAAIESSDSSRVSSANPPGAQSAEYQFPEAAVGLSTYGLPGWTRQADVLRPLAPILTARDDTFTIRAYGDARDASGRVTARAICEAVVRRSRDYVDPSDDAAILELPEQEVNQTFGRRMRIVSFRWLNPSEV